MLLLLHITITVIAKLTSALTVGMLNTVKVRGGKRGRKGASMSARVSTHTKLQGSLGEIGRLCKMPGRHSSVTLPSR